MTKRAVVVGIGQYADREAITALPFAHQDALKVSFLLKQSGEFGSPTELLDQSATVTRILAAIRHAIAGLGPDDTFLFYFSGHANDLAPSDNYLVAHDALVEDLAAGAFNGAISMAAIERLTGRCGAARILIVDACRAPLDAGAKSGDFAFGAEAARNIATVVSQRDPAHGPLVVVHSCSPNERSWEVDAAPINGGAFTHTLLGVMLDATAQRRTVVFPDDVGLVVEQCRTVLAQYLPQRRQTPLCLFSGGPVRVFGGAGRAPGPADLDLARREELAFWESVKDSRDVRLLDEYLRLYPAGLFRVVAEAIAAELRVLRFDAQTTMRFVRIAPGTFLMGSENGADDEKPVHQVTLTRGFELGMTPVTQAQWAAVMGDNPSRFKDGGGECPVENVSWDDVQQFLAKLNARQDGYEYRLPTEAEWEYAARAGTTGDYAGDLDALAWYGANAGSRTHPVGTKVPNAWGLYDMHGNVWEWVADRWADSYGSPDAVTDPPGPWLGANRVLRGGSENDTAGLCRSAYRHWLDPGDRYQHLGFRVLRVQSSRP